MTSFVITVPPDNTLQEAAAILIKNDIHGVPVVNDKSQILGIITLRDIMRAFLTVATLNKEGYQLAFMVEDKPGSISTEIVKVIHDYGGHCEYSYFL